MSICCIERLLLMSQSRPSDRASELRRLLQIYSHQYHADDAPSVSDDVYDGLFNELKKIESDHPELVTPDSPTQRVGSALKGGFKKVQHSQRMLSLNDVFNRSDIEAWVERMNRLLPGQKHEFFADIKMDGLACALVYQDGSFVQAITRGDSFVGEDITANVRTIRNVPLKLRSTSGYEKFLAGRTEIRGEIVILKKDFDKLNEQQRKNNEPEFKNPRNLAAGTVRQLDPSIVAGRPLTFIAYDVLREQPEDIPTNRVAYEAISALGMRRNLEAEVFVELSDVLEFIDKWESERHDLPFNTDGLVVKVNDREQFAELGVVGKQPRAAVAYKYAAEQTTSVVRDIVISIGRTGAATPVAVLNPVQLAGTTVQNASLHNADEIARLDVRVGDTVIVYKAGDIIPQIKGVIHDLRPSEAKPFNYTSELERQYPELDFVRPEGEAVYRVKGSTGPILLKRSLQHFASRGALDINTLGEKNVKALVDSGLVGDLADIYRLTKEDLLTLDRFGDISAEKLIKAISLKKNPPLERFVFGLGIRHVGAQTALDLSSHFGGMDAISRASFDDLISIEGVGLVVAESVLAWFADQDNHNLLNKFASVGVEPVFERKGGGLLGSSFAITGSLESMSRDEAADKIRSLGGVFRSSVTKGTTYLVAGKKVGSGKLDKARSIGVQVIDEEKLLSLLGTGN